MRRRFFEEKTQLYYRLNSKTETVAITYVSDPVVTWTNLSIRAFGKIVSLHGVIRTSYINPAGKLIFINGTLLPAALTHFCFTTPEGKSGTGYIDLDGGMIFDTHLLTGSNDIYIGFSYIAK